MVILTGTDYGNNQYYLFTQNQSDLEHGGQRGSRTSGNGNGGGAHHEHGRRSARKVVWVSASGVIILVSAISVRKTPPSASVGQILSTWRMFKGWTGRDVLPEGEAIVSSSHDWRLR
jgi:hypothetical protein